jgi:FkbM family methyltransferase
MGDGPLRALREGNYEGGELAAIERYIRPEDVVLEMGTGIGFITLFCSRVVGAKSVHTFEANPSLETKIRKNFALNNMFPHLTIAVLGDRDGEVEFHLQPEYWSSSRLKYANSTQSVMVKQLSVNKALEAIRPTMIVMDIEGGECELVPMMNLTGVKRFMLELHPFLTGEKAATSVVNRLLSDGFEERWSCPDHMHILFERV